MLTYEHFCEYMSTKHDEVLKTHPELAMSQGAAIDVMVEKAKRNATIKTINEFAERACDALRTGNIIMDKSIADVIYNLANEMKEELK